MERLVPYLLLLMGMGAAHLAIGGLVRLRPERPEFWLFGLGVRSRAGAWKVLVVAALLLLLGYSVLRRGSIQKVLDPSQPASDEQFESQRQQLIRANEQIEEYRNQMAALNREMGACQEIVSRQGLGMAKTGDAAAELRASLSLRQSEIGSLQSSLTKVNDELTVLRNENERLVQSSGLAKEQVGQLESQLDVLKNEKTFLSHGLEVASKANESENLRLKEENSKLKAQYREQDRRASLLRQGLVLREANDWALEQEIQRLANLLSDQPEVNTPRQTDLARSLQKINQVLREGQGLTKQAKVADSQPPVSVPEKTPAVPGKNK
jgi:DNA repair exonuclease SbcCD ATPase subunit